MTDTSDGRVAVYMDFDNIVMSWYDRVHGRNSYGRDRAKIAADPTEPEIAARLKAATVDVGAILDFAASYGTLVLTRAYADWSSPVNAIYRRQLVGRAVDLVQLFPAAAYAKNGADIRLAVDTVEDMFRLPDLTHVAIVAGDSDFVPLTQRVKRLGRYVIGIGVAGSTAKSLAAACDAFEPYDTLPGVPEISSSRREEAAEPKQTRSRRYRKPEQAEQAEQPEQADLPAAPEQAAEAPHGADDQDDDFLAFADTPPEDLHAVASNLLERALRVGQDKGDDQGFLYASAVKQHIRRMDPSFSEKALGYRSFNDFLASRDNIAELHESGHERLVRLKE
ncbi:MAG: NYN domain-containing protein [Microbacterium gubbeenense]|uniref:NYN domain-containing protein n=1 Tax=Microbacterium gubbeenense TaxID=159896 RepID=UPI003F95A3DA